MYIFICVLWIHVYLNTLYIVQWIHVHLNTLYVVQWIHVVSLPWEPDPRSWSPKLGTIPLGIEYRLTPLPTPHTTPPLIASPILRIHIHEQNTNKYWYSSVYIYDAQCTPCIMDFWQSVTQSRRSVNEEGQGMGGSAYKQIICYNPVQK